MKAASTQLIIYRMPQFMSGGNQAFRSRKSCMKTLMIVACDSMVSELKKLLP